MLELICCRTSVFPTCGSTHFPIAEQLCFDPHRTPIKWPLCLLSYPIPWKDHICPSNWSYSPTQWLRGRHGWKRRDPGRCHHAMRVGEDEAHVYNRRLRKIQHRRPLASHDDPGCSENMSSTTSLHDVSNVDRMFALGKSLHLRRHRSEASRSLALRLFCKCLQLRPDWRETDTKFAVDCDINEVFSTFSCQSDTVVQCDTSNTNIISDFKPDSNTVTDVAKLRSTCVDIGYTASRVQDRLRRAGGEVNGQRLPGPYYLRKDIDHTKAAALGPPKDELDAAIRLFLLGRALRRTDVEQGLGVDAVAAASRLGMMGNCPADSSLVVSLVQLFPLDATIMLPPLRSQASDGLEHPRTTLDNGHQNLKNDVRSQTVEKLHGICGEGTRDHGFIAPPSNLLFATDWPPPGSTALREEPVMYIGPDSIGLVQHSPYDVRPLSSEVISRKASDVEKASANNIWNQGPSSATAKDPRTAKMGVYVESILDLCCGSGVQGIAAAAIRQGDASITCVDINPRAVRFARFNACLNGLSPQRFKAVVGDLYDALDKCHASMGGVSQGHQGMDSFESDGRAGTSLEMPGLGAGMTPEPQDDRQSPASPSTRPDNVATTQFGTRPRGNEDCDEEPHRRSATGESNNAPSPESGFDLILANPPFVPVPPKLDAVRRRYDVFAAGGPTGEEVLQRIFSRSLPCLRPGGLVAVVSELANPTTFGTKLQHWIGHHHLRPTERLESTRLPGSEITRLEEPTGSDGENSAGKLDDDWAGVVFHEMKPLTAREYAARRAGSNRETEGWVKHLEAMGIESMAPGFVFVRRRQRQPEASDSRDHRRRRREEEPLRRSVEIQGVEKLWAPHNRAAVEETRGALRQL